MSRTINILPENLANKIAAGEVIQRPASAVKELVENSIDAGATTITIIIKDGGKGLIEVIDDGRGMCPEDAAIAFERHSTSKISSFEDLETIRTLGFRGEALASIASISQVELRTREASADVGTKVRIDGGIKIEISEETASVGTMIAVKNLFHNTPARRKFLKNTNTEFKHIYDVIQRIAISRPQLELKFVSNDETIAHFRRAPLAQRLKDVFGEKQSGALFDFGEETEFVAINGFLGKPDFARKGRIEQFLFLNNRYIVNRGIQHAVFQAYENLLEKGSFPFFILFLTIDPRRVDVNVHPSKLEVKFDDEQSMYRFVLSAVRKTLTEHDLVPSVGLRGDASADIGMALRHISGQTGGTHRAENWWKSPSSARVPAGAGFAGVNNSGDEIVGNTVPSSQMESIPKESPYSKSSIWQIHNKYIMVPIENGLMIVDQHAAHERVIYEHVQAMFSSGEKESQQLLFPHTIEMSPGYAALVNQLLPDMEKMGFSIKMFGKTTVIVDGVPNDVRPGAEGTILQDMLNLYKQEEQDLKLEPRERLAKSFSCRAAIKAGAPLNQAEMCSLLDQLFATQIPYVCPHGRPVIVRLALSELDRRFGRTS